MQIKSKPQVHIEDGQTLSFVSASFIFREEEGKAGQSVKGQLALKSNAHQGSAPIVLSSIHLEFNGSVNRVVLRHDDATDIPTHQKPGGFVLSAVPLVAENGEDSEEGQVIALEGTANLTLAPGQTAVFGIEIPLREPGETSAVSLTLNIDSAAFHLDQYLSLQQVVGANLWYLPTSKTKRIARASLLTIRVLPRPPQMEIVGLTWRDQYYTDEPVTLDFEIINEEDVDAPAKLDVILTGDEAPVFTVGVAGRDGETSSNDGGMQESKLSGLPLGAIQSSKSILAHVRVPPIPRSGQYNVILKVVYHLTTDPGTPITQTSVFQLNIVNPFEANYDLVPRVHPDPWPSFFDPDGVRDPSEEDSHVRPKGLSQAWSLITRYASFASEDLHVLDVDIRVQTPYTVRCQSSRTLPRPSDSGDAWIVKPKTIQDAAFDIIAQKQTLDDRGPATLDVSFVIKWTRLSAPATQNPNSTTLPVPRFPLFGTEPRVLASVSHLRLSDNKPLVVLRVVIENASNHFLTFGLTMEPSDEFAFSGPKQTTVNLLPVSRRSVTYRLLPLMEIKEEGQGGGGTWIKPGLIVRDKYFQKVLRVIPTEGMKLDKEGGFLIWVPPEKKVDEVESEAEEADSGESSSGSEESA